METPGSMIKRARIECGVSLDELSQTTRISGATLSHLERDSYDELPAEVFVRGFLRNVARELDLSSSAIIQAYEQHTGRVHKPAMKIVKAAAAPARDSHVLPHIQLIKRLTAQPSNSSGGRSGVFDRFIDAVGSARPTYVIASLVVLLGVALGISVMTTNSTDFNPKGPSKATWNVKADGPKARWILDGQSNIAGAATATELGVTADQAND